MLMVLYWVSQYFIFPEIYKYKNGRTDVCLFVCWYVEG